jgi:hypothetical protein
MNDLAEDFSTQRLVIGEWMTYGHRIHHDGRLDLYIYGKDDSLTVAHFPSDTALAELLSGLKRMCLARQKAVRA